MTIVRLANYYSITDAMQKNIKNNGRIEIDEDNCTEAVKILGSDITGFDVESMDMNPNYANHRQCN